MHLLLPAIKLAELIVLALHGIALHDAELQFLVGSAELIILPEQFGARQDGIARLADELLGGFGQTEERQEKTSDGQLDLIRRVMRQIQNNQRQYSDQTQGNKMRPF